MFEPSFDVLSHAYQAAIQQLANKDKEIEKLKTDVTRLESVLRYYKTKGASCQDI